MYTAERSEETFNSVLLKLQKKLLTMYTAESSEETFNNVLLKVQKKLLTVYTAESSEETFNSVLDTVSTLTITQMSLILILIDFEYIRNMFLNRCEMSKGVSI